MGMCREVGIPKEVRIRRDLIDAHIEMQRFVLIVKRMDRMMSGSHREGFCLKTSDLDLMVWLGFKDVSSLEMDARKCVILHHHKRGVSFCSYLQRTIKSQKIANGEFRFQGLSKN